MNTTIEAEAKKFIESMPLTLSDDMFGGYKVTYSFLVALLEEFAKSQIEVKDKEVAYAEKMQNLCAQQCDHYRKLILAVCDERDVAKAEVEKWKVKFSRETINLTNKG